jgi:hypothetical protein
MRIERWLDEGGWTVLRAVVSIGPVLLVLISGFFRPAFSTALGGLAVAFGLCQPSSSLRTTRAIVSRWPGFSGLKGIVGRTESHTPSRGQTGTLAISASRSVTNEAETKWRTRCGGRRSAERPNRRKGSLESSTSSPGSADVDNGCRSSPVERGTPSSCGQRSRLL